MPLSPANPDASAVATDDVAADDWIDIGRFQAPHGVRGWVRFKSFTEDPATALSLRPWCVADRAGNRRTLEIEASRAQGDHFVVKLKGVNDRDAAALQAGVTVQVASAALPDAGDGQIYWRDLAGMTVINIDGHAFGAVEAVFDNGAHDVLVVRGGDQERLIPFVPAYVRAVDTAGRKITVDWGRDWD